ncbi:hypothetical protein [Peribacillus loiseleuriae]
MNQTGKGINIHTLLFQLDEQGTLIISLFPEALLEEEKGDHFN